MNAVWCLQGTHATVRFSKEAFEVTKDIVTFNEEEDEDILVEE